MEVVYGKFVIHAGLATGVKTYIIMSPLLYGRGNGYFNRLTAQVFIILRVAFEVGRAEVVGEGGRAKIIMCILIIW